LATEIHEIDGCKVFLGFDKGAVAGVELPSDVASYAWEDVHFPEFAGQFAPPASIVLSSYGMDDEFGCRLA